MALLGGLAVACGSAGGLVPAFVLAAAAVLVAEGLLTQCGSAEAAALAAFRGGAGDAPARPPTRPPAQGRVRRLGRMEVSRR